MLFLFVAAAATHAAAAFVGILRRGSGAAFGRGFGTGIGSRSPAGAAAAIVAGGVSTGSAGSGIASIGVLTGLTFFFDGHN